METFFILSSIFIFSLFIIKGLESIRNKAYKSLNSTRVVKKIDFYCETISIR